MSKKFLRSGKVSDAEAFVDEATRWAQNLVRTESRGHGDYGNAMRRVASRLHVPFTALWNLHYRKPKTIGVEIFCALGEAINEKQRRYREERQHMEATTSLGRALLGAADWLAREEKEESLDP